MSSNVSALVLFSGLSPRTLIGGRSAAEHLSSALEGVKRLQKRDTYFVVDEADVGAVTSGNFELPPYAACMLHECMCHAGQGNMEWDLI